MGSSDIPNEEESQEGESAACSHALGADGIKQSPRAAHGLATLGTHCSTDNGIPDVVVEKDVPIGVHDEAESTIDGSVDGDDAAAIHPSRHPVVDPVVDPVEVPVEHPANDSEGNPEDTPEEIPEDCPEKDPVTDPVEAATDPSEGPGHLNEPRIDSDTDRTRFCAEKPKLGPPIDAHDVAENPAEDTLPSPTEAPEDTAAATENAPADSPCVDRDGLDVGSGDVTADTSPEDGGVSVVIKAAFGQDIRRVTISSTVSLGRLTKLLAVEFGLSEIANRLLELQWIDDDDDVITIRTMADLSEALVSSDTLSIVLS